jgi:phosphoglycolate phosphatase-like HAD superfamily hydrolase
VSQAGFWVGLNHGGGHPRHRRHPSRHQLPILPGLVALKDRGHAVVLASSAKADEVEHYVGLLDAAEIVDGGTTSADVEATKPAPDLVRAGLARVGGRAGEAMMVGDTPWDIEAAAKTSVPTLAVVTGDFSGQELLDAGALAVYESVAELERRLHDTPLK